MAPTPGGRSADTHACRARRRRGKQTKKPDGAAAVWQLLSQGGVWEAAHEWRCSSQARPQRADRGPGCPGGKPGVDRQWETPGLMPRCRSDPRWHSHISSHLLRSRGSSSLRCSFSSRLCLTCLSRPLRSPFPSGDHESTFRRPEGPIDSRLSPPFLSLPFPLFTRSPWESGAPPRAPQPPRWTKLSDYFPFVRQRIFVSI